MKETIFELCLTKQLKNVNISFVSPVWHLPVCLKTPNARGISGGEGGGVLLNAIDRILQGKLPLQTYK